MSQSIEELIAERDMLKNIVIKTVKPNCHFSTGHKYIKAYFTVMGDITYGFIYEFPGPIKRRVNRMGYDSIQKAQKGLEIAMMAEKKR